MFIKSWFWVVGPGVNTKTSAIDADQAAQVVSKISKTPAKELKVYLPTGPLNKYSEMWHIAQVL
jgi:hypothetical protein